MGCLLLLCVGYSCFTFFIFTSQEIETEFITLQQLVVERRVICQRFGVEGLHAKFYPHRCRVGVQDPKTENFMQFWNINAIIAQQGCICLAIFMTFSAFVVSFILG